MNSLEVEINNVLKFWFEELTPKQWWMKSDELDNQIKERFGKLHQLAHEGGLATARTTPEARLSEIIILDQFSRNIYREKPQSFASDPLALSLAQEAVDKGEDLFLSEQKRHFLYLPYMHSESIEVHDEAVKLFEKLGNEEVLKFEHAHRDIIVRFGRYPHRNQILGRNSTAEEIEFLKQPGSSF